MITFTVSIVTATRREIWRLFRTFKELQSHEESKRDLKLKETKAK